MMNSNTSDDAVARFLEKLGETASSATVDRSAEQLLDRLESEYRQMRVGSNVQRKHPVPLRWLGIAASFAVVGVVTLFISLTNTHQGSIATVESGTVLLLNERPPRFTTARDSLRDNQAFETEDGGAILQLSDGSHVEVSPSSHLSITGGPEGIEIKLAGGKVLISAAKQVRGTLSVRTGDCLVRVTGTAFAVRAEQTGTRVSVLEGQVEMRSGESVHLLSAGEQIATSPVLGLVPIEADIAWSPRAISLLRFLQAPQPGKPEGAAGRIAGIVSDLVSGAPLANAMVFIQRTGAAALEARTGNDGRFEIRNVPAGSYILVASRDGYWMLDSPVQRASLVQSGLPLKIAVGDFIDDLRVRMIRASSISGYVKEEDGQPARALSLKLWRVNYTGGGIPELVPANAGASGGITDDRGRYEFRDVLPGEYYVRTETDSLHRWRIFSPGVLAPDEAAVVRVPPNAALSGIDIAIPDIAPHSIRFGVPKESFTWVNTPMSPASTPPRPIADRLVVTGQAPTFSLELRASGQITGTDSPVAPSDITVGENGDYKISGVPPGRYDLSAAWRGIPSWTADGRLQWPFARIVSSVEVRDEDVDLGVLVPEPSLSIPVRVTFAGTGSGQFSVLATAQQRGGFTARFSGKAPGAMQLADLSAKPYWLSFTLPAGSYVSSAQYAGRDVLSNPLIVDGTDQGPLEVVVAGPAGSVEGSVRNEAGEPVADTQVVLIPPPFRRKNPYLFVTAITDQNGMFNVSNVPPSEYTALAWEVFPGNAFLSEAWLRDYEARGVRVTVHEGQRASIQLRPTPSAR